MATQEMQDITERMRIVLATVNALPNAGGGGIDTSDATATAGDMAEGVTAYVGGKKITGEVSVLSRMQFTTPEVSFGTFGGSDRVFLKQPWANAVMFRENSSIEMAAVASDFGDAVASDVAAGKTFTSAAGLLVTGTATAVETTGNGLNRIIVNDTEIPLTGARATASYIDLDYGAQVGYCPNGDIFLTLKRGTSTSNATMRFTLADAPDGVTMVSTEIASSTSYGTSSGTAASVYMCILSGLTGSAEISLTATQGSSGSSWSQTTYTAVAVTVTGV